MCLLLHTLTTTTTISGFRLTLLLIYSESRLSRVPERPGLLQQASSRPFPSPSLQYKRTEGKFLNMLSKMSFISMLRLQVATNIKFCIRHIYFIVSFFICSVITIIFKLIGLNDRHNSQLFSMADQLITCSLTKMHTNTNLTKYKGVEIKAPRAITSGVYEY